MKNPMSNPNNIILGKLTCTKMYGKWNVIQGEDWLDEVDGYNTVGIGYREYGMVGNRKS